MAGRSPTKVSGEYASGVAFPFRADGDGGFDLAEGDDYIRGLVLSAVQPNYSDNPFQDIGGTDFPVFQNAGDVGWRQTYRRRIRDTFGLLERENLARLVSVKFQTADESADTGDVACTILYINLENAQQRDLTVNLAGADTIGTAAQVPGFVG